MLYANNNINDNTLHYKIRIRCDDKKKLFWNNDKVTIEFLQENTRIISNIVNSNFHPNIKQINITTATLCSDNNNDDIKYLEFYLDYDTQNNLTLDEEFYNFIKMLQDENFNATSRNNIDFYNLQDNKHKLLYAHNFRHNIHEVEQIEIFESTRRFYSNRKYNTCILFNK